MITDAQAERAEPVPRPPEAQSPWQGEPASGTHLYMEQIAAWANK